MTQSDPITITEDGGLVKVILTPGTGSTTPPKDATVKVHYTGRLLDGTVFDSSVERGTPFEFKIGTGQVIAGWDQGVATMTVGERAELTCAPNYAYGAAGSPPKIPADATLKFEVELLSFQDMISIKGEKSIMKKVLTAGDAAVQTPNTRSTVEVTYKAMLNDGTVFNEQRDSVSFKLGDSIDITEGMECAIESMKKGETSKFVVQSEYGYDQVGDAELGVPPNAELTYEISLISFEKGPETWSMNGETKVNEADRQKLLGNACYAKQFFRRAINTYESALQVIKYEKSLEGELSERAQAINLALHSNMAAVHLKLGAFTKVIKSCTDALDIDADNVKSLFRRAQANMKTGDFDLSMIDLVKASKSEPDNISIKRMLQTVRIQVKQREAKERKTYGGIFDRLQKINEKEAKAAAASSDDRMEVEPTPVDSVTSSSE